MFEEQVLSDYYPGFRSCIVNHHLPPNTNQSLKVSAVGLVKLKV